MISIFVCHSDLCYNYNMYNITINNVSNMINLKDYYVFLKVLYASIEIY